MGLFSSNPRSDADAAKDDAHKAASNYYAMSAELTEIARELGNIEKLLKPDSKGSALSGVRRTMRAHKHNSAKMAHALREMREHLRRVSDRLKTRP